MIRVAQGEALEEVTVCGPRRRPAQIGWFRSLAEQCDLTGVPFWLKQMEVGGRVVENPPLDGVQWIQLPEGR